MRLDVNASFVIICSRPIARVTKDETSLFRSLANFSVDFGSLTYRPLYAILVKFKTHVATRERRWYVYRVHVGHATVRRR